MTFMKVLLNKEEDRKAIEASGYKQNFSPASLPKLNAGVCHFAVLRLGKLPTQHQVQWQVSQHASQNGPEHVATPKINSSAHSGTHPPSIHPSVQKLSLLHQNFGHDHGGHGCNGRILQTALSPVGQGPLFARKEKETAGENRHTCQAHDDSQGPKIGSFKETHASFPARNFTNRSRLMLKTTAIAMASTMFNFKGK
jgi:hypothetical protein